MMTRSRFNICSCMNNCIMHTMYTASFYREKFCKIFAIKGERQGTKLFLFQKPARIILLPLWHSRREERGGEKLVHYKLRPALDKVGHRRGIEPARGEFYFFCCSIVSPQGAQTCSTFFTRRFARKGLWLVESVTEAENTNLPPPPTPTPDTWTAA